MAQGCETLSRKLPPPEDASESPSLQTCRGHQHGVPYCSELSSSRGAGPLDSRSRNHLSSTRFPFQLATVFLLGLNFLFCHMGSVGDIDEVLETAVTSIYCTFVLGPALCVCMTFNRPNFTMQGLLLSYSLDKETGAQSHEPMVMKSLNNGART